MLEEIAPGIDLQKIKNSMRENIGLTNKFCLFPLMILARLEFL